MKHAFAINSFASHRACSFPGRIITLRANDSFGSELKCPAYTHGCGVNTHPPATEEMETSPARMIFKRSEQYVLDCCAHQFSISLGTRSYSRRSCVKALLVCGTAGLPQRLPPMVLCGTPGLPQRLSPIILCSTPGPPRHLLPAAQRCPAVPLALPGVRLRRSSAVPLAYPGVCFERSSAVPLAHAGVCVQRSSAVPLAYRV